MPNATAEHMDVGIDKPWQNGLACHIQNFRTRSHQVGYVVAIAYCEELAVAHRHGAGTGALPVDGDDVGVLQY